MRVKSVNGQESSQFLLSLNTEPALTTRVFEQYHKLHTQEPALKGLSPSYRNGTSFVTFAAEPLSQIHSVLPVGFIQIVERLLNSAEAIVRAEVEERQRQIQQEKQQQMVAVQAIAKKLGVPIKWE